MSNVASYQSSTNQSFNEIAPYTGQNGYHQKFTNSKCWRECGEKGTFLYHYWECKLEVLRKLKIELPYDPAVPLLGIYPEENMIWKDPCTPVLTAALFAIGRTWKQPKCALTEEWIQKLWCIYSMDYYPAIKKWTVPRAAVWADPENVLLSEVWHPLYVGSKKKRYSWLTYKTETENQLMVPGGRDS